jgi:hypothetical protein
VGVESLHPASLLGQYLRCTASFLMMVKLVEASPHIVPIVLDYFPIGWIQFPTDAGANSDANISIAVMTLSLVKVKQSINSCVRSGEVPRKTKL